MLKMGNRAAAVVAAAVDVKMVDVYMSLAFIVAMLLQTTTSHRLCFSGKIILF